MKSLNANQILQTSFNTLPLTGLVKDVIGAPAPNTAMMIYGSPGSQKSTFVIALCAYLQHLGPVCYKAIEEGIALTFRHKLERLGNIFGSNFTVQDTIEGRKGEFNGFSFVVIDSATAAGVEAGHILEMKKAYPGTMFIYIYQCTKDGKFKGSNEIEHEVDISLNADKGNITQVKNRCGGTTPTTVQEMIDFAKDFHAKYVYFAKSKPNDFLLKPESGIPSKKQQYPGIAGLLGNIGSTNPSIEIVFIKKFVTLVTGEPVSKQEILSFINDLQKAILARKIVIASKYSMEILYIQDALLQAYKTFTKNDKVIKFETNNATLKIMKNIVARHK